MKDNNYRNRRMLKIDEETHEMLKQLKRELSAIEKKDLSMSEITKRAFKSDDIQNRLRIGSHERRLGLKK